MIDRIYIIINIFKPILFLALRFTDGSKNRSGVIVSWNLANIHNPNRYSKDNFTGKEQ